MINHFRYWRYDVFLEKTDKYLFSTYLSEQSINRNNEGKR